MRTFLFALAAVVATPLACWAEIVFPDTPRQTTNEILGETRVYIWDEKGENNSGYQIVSPVTFGTTVTSGSVLLETSARTALIHTENDGARSGSVTTISDTVLSGTATISREPWPVQPFVTVGVNLPTGKETLTGVEKNTVADIDVVEQTRFGEGVNFNVGGGLIIPISQTWSATVAASHTVRGDYTPDGDTQVSFDPGEQSVVYGEVKYQTPRTLASLGVKYNSEDASTLDQVAFFDPGDSVEIYAQAVRAVTPRDTIAVSISAAQFSKNERFDPFTGTFRTDDENSAGEVYAVSAGWNRQTSFGSVGFSGQALVRERNDFEQAADQFVPARTRTLIGPNASFRLAENADLAVSLQYMRLDENEFPVTGVERSFEGAVASVSLRYSI